jgi:ArsR family transcriptional regulator
MVRSQEKRLAARAAQPQIGRTLSRDPQRAGHVAELLRALAHPIRIRIVAILCQEEAHVSALAERLEAKQAIVSQQLQILRTHRLVAVSRENGFAKYRLAEPQLRNLVCCMESCSVR